MPEFQTVTSMELLEFNPIVTDEEKEVLNLAVGTAIATDLNDIELARQLDIRWTDTRTYVSPIVDHPDKDDEPYYYEAVISPQDCAKHYVYLYGPAPVNEHPDAQPTPEVGMITPSAVAELPAVLDVGSDDDILDDK